MTDAKSENKPDNKVVDDAAKKAGDQGDASLKLSLAGNNPSDKTKINDAVAKPHELDAKKDIQEIFGRITAAKQSGDALAALIDSKKPMNEKITVTGADNKPHQMTVGERINELKKEVNDAANQSVVLAKTVDQAEVSRQLNNTIAERATIAKSLGVDVNKLTTENITEALKNPGDIDTKAKLENLLAAQTKFEDYKNLENAPAFTMMIYAQLKGGGFTNPNTPVERMENGKLKVDQADIRDAMSLIIEAGGNNNNLRYHPLYISAVNEVFPRSETGSKTVPLIEQEIQNAIEQGANGNKVEQEKSLKAAVAQADNINVSLLAQMIKDPEYANRQSPEVLKELTHTVVMAETARLQLALLNAEQGRFDEAKLLIMKVKAEYPEVIYNRGMNGGIDETNGRFPDLAKLDKLVSGASTFDPNKLNTDILNFRTQFTRLQGGNTDASSETKESLYGKGMNNTQIKADLAAISASMDGQLATEKRQLTQSKQSLDAEKAKLEAEQKALGSKKFVTEIEGKVEAQRITEQLKLVEQQKAQVEEQLSNNGKNTSLVRLLEASYDLAREDRNAANAKLSEIEQGNPAFAAEHKKDLEQMREMAKEPGWWDSWGKKLCIVGAVVVGVAAGIWLGPGAIATGAAAGTAAAAALGVGAVGTTMLAGAGAVAGITVLGAGTGLLAGGATYGARTLAENTGGVTMYKNPTTGKMEGLFTRNTAMDDARDVFGVAATATIFTALPGAAGGIAKATATAGEGTLAATAATTTMGRLTQAGLTKLAFGTTMTAGQTGIDLASGREVTAKGLALQFGVNTLIGAGSPSDTGFLARTLGKVVTVEKVAPTIGALTYVGFTQGMSAYNDHNGVRDLGASYEGFKTSPNVFGPWGYTPYDASSSVFQAAQIRAGMQSFDQGQAYYMTKGVKPVPTPTSIDNSVFKTVDQQVLEREARQGR